MMDANAKPESKMSKKVGVASCAITAIVGCDDWVAQAFVAGIAVAYIVCQTFIEWKKDKK